MRGLRRILARTALVVAGGLTCSPVLADRVELIVARDDRSVEIFMGMPVLTAVDTFGLDAGMLIGPDGRVPFESLQEGTWQIADALWERVEARIAGQTATFEGMSLMVHPLNQPLPFVTPLNGLTAISVCGVPAPEAPRGLRDLYLYAGFVAYPDDPGAPITLRLPNPKGLDLMVREHGFGGPLRDRHVHLSPGKPLELAVPRGPVAVPVAVMVVVMVAVSGLFLAFAAGRSRWSVRASA
ncbi:hypothetical protein OA50_01140 [Mameliella alba]|uniref:Uncharacterized protein n=1 Tax=Mameliella alba TaxID=561184 RepID=A0A0B3SVT4_9RHOB|nr:hypothetical protein OA50_01140 [Mameliella alba]